MALLVGCALRRRELASLEIEEIQLREGRWVIADLRGKGGRVRFVAVPMWVKQAVNAWMAAARVEEGKLLRSINKAGRLKRDQLQRTGCALLVIAMLYMLYQLVRARPHKDHAEINLLVQATHYGSELGREWNFHRGFSFWSRLAIVIPGFILLAIGRILADPASVTSNAVQLALFLFFAAAAIPNNQRFANRYASRLQELKQLQHTEGFEA